MYGVKIALSSYMQLLYCVHFIIVIYHIWLLNSFYPSSMKIPELWGKGYDLDKNPSVEGGHEHVTPPSVEGLLVTDNGQRGRISFIEGCELW